jgi:hypothetical protein
VWGGGYKKTSSLPHVKCDLGCFFIDEIFWKEDVPIRNVKYFLNLGTECLITDILKTVCLPDVALERLGSAVFGNFTICCVFTG